MVLPIILKPCHTCKDYHYKFIEKGQDWFIYSFQKALIKALLLERVLLHGICGIVKISMSWLMRFIKDEGRFRVGREMGDNLEAIFNHELCSSISFFTPATNLSASASFTIVTFREVPLSCFKIVSSINLLIFLSLLAELTVKK